MSNIHGILIFGANGSGKTTLGRELAQKLGYKHMDTEDYYFLPSDIPYTVSRTKDKVIALMLADIEKYGNFILTSVTGDYGENINTKYDLAVYLTAPLEVRIERIKQRTVKRFGERVLPGGDMYENNSKFIEYAAHRPLDRIDSFAKTLICPVIYLDGTKTVDELLNETEKYI